MAYNFAEEEKNILKFWEDNEIFKKSLDKTKRKKSFVFYDGPPFATGTPHYGHLLQSAIKDVIPRYKTMQGFYVERQWGWDCHGLPIENIVEKEIGTKSKKDILEMGVKKFNDLCREKIFTFINDWETIIPRFGRWADMKSPYKTMDFAYMQSEWWAFKELHKKGLIYENYRSMHICPRCETTLSQGEVADGYKTVKDFSITAKFKVKNPEKLGLGGNVYLLAWTTTPWTLPGNVALAVGEKIEYNLIKAEGEQYIIAEDRIKDVLKEKTFEDVKKIKGKDLVGLEYEPLFDYYATDLNLKNRENGWKVYVADFVTTDEGTGVVHIAPAFGDEDMRLGKENNLPFVQHVKMDGIFKPEVKDFSGLDLKPRAKDNAGEVREVDIKIIKLLEQQEKVFSYEKYEHTYPHCWRCDTALLNYATSSWFVAVEKIKPQLLKTAKKINWMPEHIKEGRFGQWLEGARDWSISRQRFWANTIPIWRCLECEHEIVFGSAEELEKISKQKVTDLHREFVDEIIFDCKKCKGTMKRVPDVLDTWFDSGSVPFAALHYPLENKKEVEKRLPADFIGEAQDQTRAWFYYQHVLVGALFGKEAFKNCIVTGIVLAEDGKKMAKKLKNYPDPVYMIDKYGADSMRLYMLSSGVVQAENLLFSEGGVAEVQRRILTLYNVYSFFETYVKKEEAEFSEEIEIKKLENVLDRWIVSKINHLISIVTFNLDNYNIPKAVLAIEDFFINDLSLWYIRRSRKRFHEESTDREEAEKVLYYVLLNTAKLIAPIAPFFAEKMYQDIKSNDMPESVHLCDWPKVEKENQTDLDLEQKMDEVRDIVNLALAQRSVKGVKVRQPLLSLKIKSQKSKVLDREFLDVIKEEINVKEVLFDDKIDQDVELDLNITEELKEEGKIREAIRFGNDLRKEGGYEPGDQIKSISSTSAIFSKVEVLKGIKISEFVEISNKEEIPNDYIAKEIKIEENKTDFIAIPKNK